jgi:hypothetical protein
MPSLDSLVPLQLVFFFVHKRLGWCSYAASSIVVILFLMRRSIPGLYGE